MKEGLEELGIQREHYDTYSFKAGRATDPWLDTASSEMIRETGRWDANAHRKYLIFDIFFLSGQIKGKERGGGECLLDFFPSDANPNDLFRLSRLVRDSLHSK